MVARLGDPADAVLVLDESGQEKAGEHTAGVQRQYLGCARRVANGVNVVYASYAAAAGHARPDRARRRRIADVTVAGRQPQCASSHANGRMDMAHPTRAIRHA